MSLLVMRLVMPLLRTMHVVSRDPGSKSLENMHRKGQVTLRGHSLVDRLAEP